MPVSRYTEPQLRQDPEVYAVVTVTWGGVTYRLSDRPRSVSSDDGDLPILGALDALSWDESGGEVGATDDGSLVVAVECTVPDLDLAALVDAGRLVDRTEAEVATLIDGDAWEDRRIALVGVVSDPTYGAQGEPIAFAVDGSPGEDRALIPSSAEVVSRVTWSAIADEAEGLPYPIVIGQPGLTSVSAVPGSTCPVVDRTGRRVLLTGAAVAASTVRLIDGPTGSIAAVTPSLTTDDQGSTTTVATLPAAADTDGDGSNDAWLTSSAIYASWNDGGGILSPYSGGPLRNAGEVLRWMLDRSTLRVDQGRTQRAAALLSGYQVDACIDARVSPWDWLRAHLLPLLPVSIAAGGRGLYPIVWRFDATSSDAVTTLDAARDPIDRLGPVQLVGDPVSEVEVRYGYDIARGQSTQTVVHTGDPEMLARASDYTQVVSSTYARAAYARYERRTVSVETQATCDAATAAAAARWRMLAGWRPPRRIGYTAPRSLVGWLEAGDVVQCTDSDLAISSQLALVESVTAGDTGAVGISMRIIERSE